MNSSDAWPALAIDSWTDTRDTLHMWLQAVGKVQLVSTPLINHWWNTTYELSARGLRTRLMYDGESDRGFDAEFDVVEHELVIRTVDGQSATVTLEPKTVAAFWEQVLAAMSSIGLGSNTIASPNEVSPAIPFAQDTQHRSYDAQAAHTWWRQLRSAGRVFAAWRAGFAGKDSPVQLFWGSMDLSCTRYSGRVAPPAPSHVPNCPPYVMTEAESRENAAVGFWPGGSAEGTFYAYVVPEPKGYRDASLASGSYDETLGEWVLPYEQVRTSRDPDATLLAFLDGTYALAADLGKWDRKVLDVDPHRLDRHIYRGSDRTPLS